MEECANVNGLEPGKWYGATYVLAKDSGCTAYYTTDGSTPSPTNGTKVTKADGRVKVKARHTGDYGGIDDTIDIKIHCYVKGKLVALDYYENIRCMCVH